MGRYGMGWDVWDGIGWYWMVWDDMAQIGLDWLPVVTD